MVTHFPHGIDVGSLSNNGVTQVYGTKIGKTHFPHGIIVSRLSVGGVPLVGGDPPGATKFPDGIDTPSCVIDPAIGAKW